MTDKREIEGSPERAADRGRADDLGFSVSKIPSLGNAHVIYSLMTEFASACVDIRKRYNKDEINDSQAKVELKDLAREYGNIIMGRDERYQALPWNSESRLGRRIKLVVPDIPSINNSGEMLFLTVGTSLMAIASSHEQGKITDEAGEKHTKEMLADAANLILGIR